MSVFSLIVILLGAASVAAAQWKGADPGVVALIAAATGYLSVTIEHRAMLNFKRKMAEPAPTPSSPNDDWVLSYDPHVSYDDYLELLAECRDLRRECKELKDGQTQAQVDVSNLSEGFAYRIYRKAPRGERYDPIPYAERGITTDPLLAASLVDQGWMAQLLPVWVLADGRVARKRSDGAPNYFTIIKEIQA